MGSVNKRKELMEATMQIIAEDGIASFAMKKVTERVGVSEALIYKFFATKDNLLSLCFASINQQIVALLADAPALTAELDPAVLQKNLFELWSRYIHFMVENGYRTLFYFAYRNAPSMREVRKETMMLETSYFERFSQIVEQLDQKYHILAQVDKEFLWTYVLDTSNIFARRIIRGELPDAEASYQQVWKLMSGGLFGLLAA